MSLGSWIRFFTGWQTPQERSASAERARKLEKQTSVLALVTVMPCALFTFAAWATLIQHLGIAAGLTVVMNLMLPSMLAGAVRRAASFVTSDPESQASAANSARGLWLLALVGFWAWTFKR